MKKYFVLLLPSLLLFAATYTPRTVSQNWKLNTPETLERLETVSGKWEIATLSKVNQPFLSQKVRYADFPKALIKDKDYYDFDASVRLYLSSENQETQSAGLILRYRNLYSFYMLFINSKDKRITLTKASLAGLKVLKRVEHTFEPDRWYDLKAVCYLDTIKGYVDGELLLDAKDETSTGGKIGLVTAGTSQVYFDDLRINSEAIEVTK